MERRIFFSSEAKTLVFTTKNSKIKSKNSEICIMSKNDLEDLKHNELLGRRKIYQYSYG